jgi:hypothetical protein
MDNEYEDGPFLDKFESRFSFELYSSVSREYVNMGMIAFKSSR